tara:strand:- start:5082 stop:5489 length:408 start_codon:yes stop_codon:yes gene_type:complete
MIKNTTHYRDYPRPHKSNLLQEDVSRIGQALEQIDADIHHSQELCTANSTAVVDQMKRYLALTQLVASKAEQKDVYLKAEAQNVFLQRAQTAVNASQLGGQPPSHYVTQEGLQQLVSTIKTLFLAQTAKINALNL